jgi:hypothetical protein
MQLTSAVTYVTGNQIRLEAQRERVRTSPPCPMLPPTARMKRQGCQIVLPNGPEVPGNSRIKI